MPRTRGPTAPVLPGRQHQPVARGRKGVASASPHREPGDGQPTVTGPGSTPTDLFLLLSARWLIAQLRWPCRASAVSRDTARRYFLPNRQALRRVERVEGSRGSTDAGLVERDRFVDGRGRLQNVCKMDLGRPPEGRSIAASGGVEQRANRPTGVNEQPRTLATEPATGLLSQPRAKPASAAMRSFSGRTSRVRNAHLNEPSERRARLRRGRDPEDAKTAHQAAGSGGSSSLALAARRARPYTACWRCSRPTPLLILLCGWSPSSASTASSGGSSRCGC